VLQKIEIQQIQPFSCTLHTTHLLVMQHHAEDDDICYICYSPFTQADAIYDPECACSYNIQAHYSCLINLCQVTGKITCSICKEPYRDLTVTIPVHYDTYVDYITYTNGSVIATTSICKHSGIIIEHN
jgi:hypothetical protein